MILPDEDNGKRVIPDSVRGDLLEMFNPLSEAASMDKGIRFMDYT